MPEAEGVQCARGRKKPVGSQGPGIAPAAIGAQGGGAHGPFGSVSRSCKYRDTKEGKWGERTKRDLEYDHKNVFLWGQFKVAGEEQGHPAPPNRGQSHENQLQIITAMEDKGRSRQFCECDGGKETALHDVPSGIQLGPIQLF